MISAETGVSRSGGLILSLVKRTNLFIKETNEGSSWGSHSLSAFQGSQPNPAVRLDEKEKKQQKHAVFLRKTDSALPWTSVVLCERPSGIFAVRAWTWLSTSSALRKSPDTCDKCTRAEGVLFTARFNLHEHYKNMVWFGWDWLKTTSLKWEQEQLTILTSH